MRAAALLLCAAVACAAAPAQAPRPLPAATIAQSPPPATGPDPSCYDRQLHPGPATATTAASATPDFGLTKAAINEVVRQSLTQIKICYERQLQRRPSLEGTVSFAWTIEPSGRVSQAYPVEVTLDSPEVVDCIGQSICWWTFSAAPARTRVGRYPFVFKNGAETPPASSGDD